VHPTSPKKTVVVGLVVYVVDVVAEVVGVDVCVVVLLVVVVVVVMVVRVVVEVVVVVVNVLVAAAHVSGQRRLTAGCVHASKSASTQPTPYWLKRMSL
jgi:hypothetical protein